MEDYKEKVLGNLGIYELRELARSLGVTSPTSKRRKVLEDEIMKISKGEIKPNARKSKKGRPPKSLQKMENVVDVFIPRKLTNVSFSKKRESNESILKFASSESVDNQEYLITGFLKKTESNFYYIRNKNSLLEYVTIPYNYILKHELIEGDKLSVIAKRVEGEQFSLYQLLTINGNDISNEKRRFESIEDIVFGKNSMKGFEGVFEGENVLLITENIKPDIEIVKEAIKPLSENYTIVLVASGISTYTKLMIEKDLQAEFICTVVEDHPALAYENIINAFNHTDLLLKQGKKVAFVVLDIFTLKKLVEEFLILENEKTKAEANVEALRVLKKTLDYGKVLKSSASVTVFAHCLKNEIEESLYKEELSKLPDKLFYL